MPVASYLTINIICDIFNVSVLGLRLKFDNNRCAIRIAKFKIYIILLGNQDPALIVH